MKKIKKFFITTALFILTIGIISFVSLLTFADSNNKPLTHYLRIIKNQFSSNNNDIDATINNSTEAYVPSSYPNTSSPNYNKPFDNFHWIIRRKKYKTK